MKAPFTPGRVGHFSLAVHDPKASAAWFQRCLLFQPYMEFEDVISVGNDSVTIWFHKGRPGPSVIGHMAFALEDRAELERALEHLKNEGVKVEDPGHEIGPQAPGSKYIGIWFHDPDGYRWEFSVAPK